MKRLVACFMLLLAQSVSAAITINISETASGVEATLSGSMNLAAITFDNRTSSGYDGYYADEGGISFQADSLDVYAIGGITWTPYGDGGFDQWDSTSGDAFHMWTDEFVGFASDYVSGDPLSASATKTGVTLADLGMIPGEYVNTLTNDAATDTITIIVGEPIPRNSEPVPAMSVWGLVLLSLMILVVMRHRATKHRVQN